MKNIKILSLIAILFLSACASTPAVRVAEAQGIDSVSALGMGCKKPFLLTQDCSGFSGPTKKINVRGQEAKIAGNADGTITVMFGGSATRPTNFAFGHMKVELESRGFTIIKVTPIESAGIMFGHAIETTEPNYQMWNEF